MEWKTSRMTNDLKFRNLPAQQMALSFKRLFAMGIISLLSTQNLSAQQFFQPGNSLAPIPDVNVSIQAAPPVEMESNEDFETYNRGPLHEAFATPSSDTAVEGIIIKKQPPELVNELIPDERPDGESVVWIPGYWSYDEELDDFLWITGVWRDIPPGMRWVPGYWEEVEEGFRWVSGVWMPIETAEIDYLPTPPESLEIGPSSIAPSENYCWIPGNWAYANTSYAWNPGYWSPVRNDYCWAPPRYIYTSRGCLYSPGYWDYAPIRRGLVFAPIRFFRPNRIIAVNYRPRFVINTWRNFYSTLFVSNRRGCYAYGNFFGPQHVNRGFIHISLYTGNRRGFYDPLYNYNRARYGNTFSTQLTGWNNHFERNENDRPGLTFREEIQLRQQQPQRNQIVPFSITNNLQDVVRKKETNIQFTKLNTEQLANVNRVSSEMRDLSRERKQIEARDVKLIRIDNNNINNVNPPVIDGNRENKLKPDNNNILPGTEQGNNNNNNESNKNPKLPGRDITRDNKPLINDRPKLSLANNKGLINNQIKQKEILIQEQVINRDLIRTDNINQNGNTPNISNKDNSNKPDGKPKNTANVDAESRLRVKTESTNPVDRLTAKERRELDNQNSNSTNSLNPLNPGNNNFNNPKIIRGNDVSNNSGNNGNPGMNNDNSNNKTNNPRAIRTPDNNSAMQDNRQNIPGISPPNQGKIISNDNVPSPGEMRRLDRQTPPLGNNTSSGNNFVPNNDIPNNGLPNNNIGLPKNTTPRIDTPKGPTPGEMRRTERQTNPPVNNNPGNINNSVPFSGTPNTGIPNMGSSTNRIQTPKITAPKIDTPKGPSPSEIRRTERQSTPPPTTSKGTNSVAPSNPPRETRSSKSTEGSPSGNSGNPPSGRSEGRAKKER